jgi:hypothetical protein
MLEELSGGIRVSGNIVYAATDVGSIWFRRKIIFKMSLSSLISYDIIIEVRERVGLMCGGYCRGVKGKGWCRKVRRGVGGGGD